MVGRVAGRVHRLPLAPGEGDGLAVGQAHRRLRWPYEPAAGDLAGEDHQTHLQRRPYPEGSRHLARPGSGIAVSRGYLKDHADEVKSFLTAYQEAWTYAADPANKAGVIGVLAKYTQSDERLGEISYQAMIPIWTGNKTPRVNPQAVSNLLQVSGVPDAATANPEQFFDDSLIDSVAPPG